MKWITTNILISERDCVPEIILSASTLGIHLPLLRSFLFPLKGCCSCLGSSKRNNRAFSTVFSNLKLVSFHPNLSERMRQFAHYENKGDIPSVRAGSLIRPLELFQAKLFIFLLESETVLNSK